MKKHDVLHHAAFLNIEVMQPGTAMSSVSIVSFNNALVQLEPIENTVREVKPPPFYTVENHSVPQPGKQSKTEANVRTVELAEPLIALIFSPTTFYFG